MALKPHENIRVQVAQLLRDLLRRIVSERYKITKDLYSYMLLKILELPERITVLIPQEVRVGTERKWVDMTLGGTVVFEFKSNEREFHEAESDAMTRYWPVVSKAKFFIVTNLDKWRIYTVTTTGLSLVEECGKQEAIKYLEAQIIPQVKEIKIPPLPENVESLYKLDHEALLERLRKAFNAVKDDSRIRPLYEAYKSLMSLLYSRASEEFFEDLITRHTYMQLAVLASLTTALGKVGRVEDVCSGSLIYIDIALPYLNWWKAALHNEATRDLIEEVLREVVARANLIDWSLGTAEDVFRTLYEFLVEPSVRRELGEYYTPIWLVEMMLSEFDIKGKIILDPFCGSGTFLVRAFYRKVDEGEDPDSALNEVIGFDVNPLAVAVARAELVIAYKRVSGREPESPPHIYHVDTFATWFGGSMISIMGIEDLMRKASTYLQTLINFKQITLDSTSEILATLRGLERNLTYAIRFSYGECKLDFECLREKIESYLEQSLRNSKDVFTQKFLEHFKRDNVASSIANLIVRHGGNDVWAVVLISIYTPILMTKFKPDIIVTNPPWIPVTEYRASYSSKIREYMLNRISKCVGDTATQILSGADIAAAALGKAIELANEGVGFVMNRDQSFNYKSPTQAGVVATYCILRDLLGNSAVSVKLFDISFDVFQHGVPPAVVIVKRRRI